MKTTSESELYFKHQLACLASRRPSACGKIESVNGLFAYSSLPIWREKITNKQQITRKFDCFLQVTRISSNVTLTTIYCINLLSFQLTLKLPPFQQCLTLERRVVSRNLSLKQKPNDCSRNDKEQETSSSLERDWKDYWQQWKMFSLFFARFL